MNTRLALLICFILFGSIGFLLSSKGLHAMTYCNGSGCPDKAVENTFVYVTGCEKQGLACVEQTATWGGTGDRCSTYPDGFCGVRHQGLGLKCDWAAGCVLVNGTKEFSCCPGESGPGYNYCQMPAAMNDSTNCSEKGLKRIEVRDGIRSIAYPCGMVASAFDYPYCDVYYNNHFSGYFTAETSGYYQFMVDAYPFGGFGIDLNGDGQITCADPGAKKLGDRYFAKNVSCNSIYLPEWAKTTKYDHWYHSDNGQCSDNGHGWGFPNGDPRYCKSEESPCSDDNYDFYQGGSPGNVFPNRSFERCKTVTNDTAGQTKFWSTDFPWQSEYPAGYGHEGVPLTDPPGKPGFAQPVNYPKIPPFYTQDAWRTAPNDECIFNTPYGDMLVPVGNGQGVVRIWARRYLNAGYYKVGGWYSYNQYAQADPDNDSWPRKYLSLLIKRPGDASFIDPVALPRAQCPFTPCTPCTNKAPTAPSLNLPQNNALLAPTAAGAMPSVTLGWAEPSDWGKGCQDDAKKYYVCVGTSEARAGETDPNRCDVVAATVDWTGTTQSGVIGSTIPLKAGVVLEEGREYWWRVKAYKQDAATNGTSSSIWKFTMPMRVAGNVYQNTSLSSCSGSNSLSTPTITLTGNGVSKTASNATSFSWLVPVLPPSTAYTLSVTPPTGNTCFLLNNALCQNIGCSKTISNPTSRPFASLSNHVYLNYMELPWFQGLNGDIYSRGNITTIVPSTAVNKYFIGPSTAGNKTRGLPIAGITSNGITLNGASIGLGRVNGAIFEGVREDFDYFKHSFKLQVSTDANTKDLGNVSTYNLATLPASYPTGREAFYQNGAITFTSGSNAAVNVTGSKVIFVNGNVTVDQNITVSAGNFFAIVSSGTITFSNRVTAAQGVYIANQQLQVTNAADATTGMSNRQFNGQGIFVGWGGVTLSRNLNSPNTDADNLDNNQYPAELFTYRSDLLLSAPDGFKQSKLEWKELEPVVPTP